MNDYSVMPFGKYEGNQLKDVPASYLIWLYGQSWLTASFPELANYIADGFEELQSEARDQKWNSR